MHRGGAIIQPNGVPLRLETDPVVTMSDRGTLRAAAAVAQHEADACEAATIVRIKQSKSEQRASARRRPYTRVAILRRIPPLTPPGQDENREPRTPGLSYARAKSRAVGRLLGSSLYGVATGGGVRCRIFVTVAGPVAERRCLLGSAVENAFLGFDGGCHWRIFLGDHVEFANSIS